MILFSFPAAEKKHAEEERRDHEYLKNNRQKRINAAAAPDAIKVNGLAITVPTAPAEAEKKVNGDFVLRPKLIKDPFIIGKYCAAFKSVNMVKLTTY
jgi:hypothetical protein